MVPLALKQKQESCFTNPNNCILSARKRDLVCVTSGNSYLDSHIVKELQAHGYPVRVTIQNQVDFEDMRELIGDERINQLESVVVANVGDVDGLCDAFRGCHAIFHPSSFVDPHGVSGYSVRTNGTLVPLEAEGVTNVIEASGRAAYEKRCIFTSSLLSSIWKGGNVERVVDETSWSDEGFCRENKLWLALGKTIAEKVAWRKSKEMKVELVTLCPGVIMAPSFPNAHKETSVPYLKGGQSMLQQGILATGDVKNVAEAHVYVYEAMDNGASGRYLCFERVVRRLEEAIELENGLHMHGLLSGRRQEVFPEGNEEIRSNLDNSKLAKLILQASRRSSCKQ
ncbi:cinnamoyl-CoA reductase-like SNL6 [Carya illinoinensis]|uniref:cinnamoyl-CoA reductase-like SNL6 n=1 Tax=Carya illinoinensis TaxID=32201 RepID=UPI001C71A8B4|nr:cinnamoyl-CoA reductase-like SNL6 [Carya illinoinensis]